ncbi:SMP-30/gluconolactonase/LRE family protein [Acetobacter thailandicus]|uniref:SMP-30/gluconolactonase/LRE family protein n=1 Tax=Acetobacter thailandicus TaxID=1502842 RepID=UPI001BAAA354|nr:L-dopachrome tautomerase-related protein [Acetobacter thailandicus]MBS1002333.1 gluconolactonase [Acetobacter thailandicus]
MKTPFLKMRKKAFLSCCGSALIVALAYTGAAAAADSVDHASAPTENVTVADRFEKAQPSGIARLPDGRIILSFPESAQWHPGPVLAVWSPGKLTPFPGALAQHDMISPLGMTVDAKGQLWVVDEGVRAGHKVKPQPALLHIDPAAGKIVRSYPFTKPAVSSDSHVNDVRVDLTHGKAGTAFVSDTSEKTHPALIAVDLASGKMRRILEGSVSVRPVPGLVMQVDHELRRYDPNHPVMGQGGVDGLALSADSSRLYWSPLSSRRLYSAPTAELADFHLSEEVLKSAVTDEGEVGIMDGMATAPDGSLYLTDIERHAVVRRAPDGELSIVAQDPRLIAPDSIALDGDSLLLTVGQWSRLPVFNAGKDKQERPYLLMRIAPLQTADKAP